MPYDSRTYRVLIASPSDVDEERELAVRVIQEWNDLYSYTRKAVLLPLRWETHTAPEYGTRPQEVVNRAIVDNCDLLIGIFWTRVGTPTGSTASGTIEEIERVAKAGKPIMLYFSKVGTDPDKIDLSQLRLLQDFKQQTYPNALTESFKSQIEFRDKFAKQLELKVREIQKADDPDQTPPLSLLFASPDLKNTARSLAHVAELPEVTDLEVALAGESTQMRTAVDEKIRKASAFDVLLAIGNAGSSGIRNLYIEVSVRASSKIDVVDAHKWRYDLFFRTQFADQLSEVPREVDDRWEFAFEWDAIQPQRVRLIKPRLTIAVIGETEVEFSAKVFADSLAEPVILKSQLNVSVRSKTCILTDIVADLDQLRKAANEPGVFTWHAQ